jgi:SulP family sulfate permease
MKKKTPSSLNNLFNSLKEASFFLPWTKDVKRDTIKADLIAGITVALVLIPQSLAYAQLAGLPPHYGLYASFIPPIIASFFGSSNQLSTGPVAVLSLMTQSALSPIATAGSQEYILYAILMALSLGIFQLLLGIFKLGEFVSFLSHPVIYGFTNAAAIIIATTQLSKFFGVTTGRFEHHYQSIIAAFTAAGNYTHWPTLVMGIFALINMYAFRKLNSKIPYILIIVVVTSLFSRFLNFNGEIIGSIPEGIANFSVPTLNLSIISKLFFAVVAMSLIGFTEAVSIAQAIAIKTKQRLDPNRELIGQGLANITGSFNQSYPVAGSFSRTAINFQAGAKSPLSSFFASGVILITLLFFTQFLYYLPQVVLAAIIMLSVGSLIDFRKIKTIWYTSRYDGIAAILTFVGTLYFAPDLEKGVLIGIVFSVAHYVYRTTHPRVAFLSKYKDDSLHDAKDFHLDRCENIAVIRLDAPLLFANAAYFENEIIKDLAQHKHISDMLFVASGINEIDATGEEMLSTLFQSLKKADKDVYFANVKAPVMNILRKTNLSKKIGKDHFFSTTKEAVKFLLRHVKHMHRHLDEKECPLNKYVRFTPEEEKVRSDRKQTILYFYKKILP